MTGPYAALAAVSVLGTLTTVGLVLLVVHLPLRLAAQRDAACAAERRRLAREMHDGLAQELAALGYAVDALAADAESTEQRERLTRLRGRITDLVAETRCSLAGLRIGVEDARGLGAALRTLAGHLTELSGVPIHVEVTESDLGRASRLGPEAAGELFRITQEALTNAVTHADATSIRVEGVIGAAGAHLAVTDDGRGFQGPRRGSHGLAVMEERARLIGAHLELGDAPGGGFRVAVTLPGERSGRRGEATAVLLPRRSSSRLLETS